MNSSSNYNPSPNPHLDTPSIPAVPPPILERPQITPNLNNEQFAELQENFERYFFDLLVLYLFSSKRRD